MTDVAHASVKLLAQKALAAFPNMPVAGLDLLCENVSEDLTNDNYVIIEVNSNPGLAMHTYPTEGKSINVAEDLLKVMFPYINDDV